MLRRRSGLDRLIFRFQDRWETDRQYRAMMSGVVGLVMLLALCSCMGVVTTVANGALANVNSSRNAGVSNSSQNSNTGTGNFNLPPTFPISTAPPWQQSGPPTYTIIPSSGTPIPSPTAQPTATALPTATPCQSNCGGGGGGGGGSWSIVFSGSQTPTPWVAGGSANFTIHASQNGAGVAGVGLALIYTFPGGGTVLDENNEVTDANGNYTSHFQVPGNATTGSVDLWVQAYYNGVSNGRTHLSAACK